MRATTEKMSMPYFMFLFFMKLLINAAAAIIIITTYCTMVTSGEAQNESAAGAVKVRLHCNMYTAYFWKGKMAE